ncbi:hypothetical protein SCLCIDRAFT_765780 [Scleroderma citrinum Foug A]|uniref:Uncharacterized protein n=1 Tax=Scleroderma citrinum Foug A TaxID=1036808 RepID=A0A0C2ZCL6_9AGAM|nr:hypothetical protein SCLCIDRAFT_765780 [Scleroderma citrinum Foug A]
MTNAAGWISCTWKIIDLVTHLAWKPSWKSLLSKTTIILLRTVIRAPSMVCVPFVGFTDNQKLHSFAPGDYYYLKVGKELVRVGFAWRWAPAGSLRISMSLSL